MPVRTRDPQYQISKNSEEKELSSLFFVFIKINQLMGLQF